MDGDGKEAGIHPEKRVKCVGVWETVGSYGVPAASRMNKVTWLSDCSGTGEHGNVGGGEANSGLSNQALVWMIARIQGLTGLEFDMDAVKTPHCRGRSRGILLAVRWAVHSYPPKARASRRAPCRSPPGLPISSARWLDGSSRAPPAPDLPRCPQAAFPLQRSGAPARRRVHHFAK